MADINVFTCTGRLCSDAQFRTLATGKQLLTANIAVNSGYGQYKKTLFVKIQQWGENAGKIVQYLTKGQLIGTSGTLSKNEWTAQDGTVHTDFVLDVMSIQLLGFKNDSSNNNQEHTAQDNQNDTDATPVF